MYCDFACFTAIKHFVANFAKFWKNALFNNMGSSRFITVLHTWGGSSETPKSYFEQPLTGGCRRDSHAIPFTIPCAIPLQYQIIPYTLYNTINNIICNTMQQESVLTVGVRGGSCSTVAANQRCGHWGEQRLGILEGYMGGGRPLAKIWSTCM